MDWLTQLIWGDSIAHTILLLSTVIVLGLAVGSLKFKGIGLGVAGVLFSGLLVGHFGFKISEPVLEFAREFGLILFVFTIGIQVGPGFLASLRREGLRLNLLAGAIVVTGAGITIFAALVGRIPIAAAVGLFSGATTNTPSLGAAQEAIRSLPHVPAEIFALPGLGYAVAYPFGIIGIILTMLAVRAVFQINIRKEADELAASRTASTPKLSHVTVVVTNPNLEGKQLGELSIFKSLGVVISRIKHGEKIHLAHPDDVIHVGDTILAVGAPEALADLKITAGQQSPVDLKKVESNLVVRKVFVTKKKILGQTLGELDCLGHYDVAVTRVLRAEVELRAESDLRLQFGDTLVLVGREEGIASVSKLIGNSIKHLNHTALIPIFLGIALGVIAGSIPLSVPGMPAPVKLGLAGGPLLVAILLSHIGRIGSVVWYVPNTANLAVREIGIALFLACVGLHAGERFVDTLISGAGLQWMGYAALITLCPLIVVGAFARLFLQINYVTLCGLLAGSMTDPPALAFANTITSTEDSSSAYATVYPLTMILRVLTAQLLILLFL